jgi:hypothetical protein
MRARAHARKHARTCAHTRSQVLDVELGVPAITDADIEDIRWAIAQVSEPRTRCSAVLRCKRVGPCYRAVATRCGNNLS